MDSPPPLFTAGQEIATFLVSYGILSKAWGFLARNSESFILEEDENDGIAYVAFPSFHNIDDFIVKESKYGEGESGYGELNIQTDNTVFSDCLKGEDDKPALSGYGEVNIQTDNTVFSDCLKGEDDKPALVHQGALKLFLHIMKNTDFEAKLQIYTDEKEKKLKPIIFVGHFLGGAVATLATLWVLEKRLSKSSPFCITFGCPLMGDARLAEAVHREKWGGNFCHVVSKNDIAPRMLLAPIRSIVKPLSAVLPYWQGILPYSFVQEDCRTLLENVRIPKSVLDGINDRRRSPYRPVGTYMLCSSNGAACIQNAQTVLEMLSLTMPSQQTSFDEIVQACLSEHIRYDSVLEEVLQNSIKEIRSIENSNSESPCEMGILLQLEAIGVGAQNDHAQLALGKAGETENRYNTNVDKLAIELSLKQSSMAELEWYKESCEKDGGTGYYDSFRTHIMKNDIEANLRRVKLAEFWDEIIEMWENHELPSDFQSQNKWINAGNTYRKLVEPLDIAYYYRANSNGNYLSDGRPNRHKVLQKWMEAKEKTRSSRGQRPRTKFASLTEDSCFWANVEEARKDLENLKQGQHQSLEGLEEFEDNVTRMFNYRSISSDVFFEESRFMMWWEEWKEYNKNQSPDWSSPLSKIMETESWKR